MLLVATSARLMGAAAPGSPIVRSNVPEPFRGTFCIGDTLPICPLATLKSKTSNLNEGLVSSDVVDCGGAVEIVAAALYAPGDNGVLVNVMVVKTV